VGFERDGREGELGEGFSDADDGFELTDCDGNGGTRGGGDFGRVYLAADRDEVGGELLASFGGKTGRAASSKMFQRFVCKKRVSRTYDLQ